MTFRRFFRDMRIHYKLLLGYSAVFLLILASAGAAVYYMVEQTVEQNIEERLSESTGAMLGLVKTAAEVSIKNHLRSKAEASREMVAGVYDQYLSGYMGLREAKWRAEQLLLSQNIGETGYIYCVNSDGVAVVHPRPSVENVDFSEFDFVRKQMALKEGYLEYDWKNPGEQKARPKALYMVYFEPFDWIISASSYREEFASLINVDDFREDFMARRPGGGYAFVMNSGGSFVLHPRMEGHNISETLGSKAKGFIEEIRRRKNGKLVYEWRNPGETEAREKLVIFDYIPEYDWIVASST